MMQRLDLRPKGRRFQHVEEVPGLAPPVQELLQHAGHYLSRNFFNLLDTISSATSTFLIINIQGCVQNVIKKCYCVM